MKKVIRNRVYDTETAQKLAEAEDYYQGDFRYCHEELYLKRTGEYFLYGEGGGMSAYADKYPGGGLTNGWKIIPLTYEQAREWAEDHMETDDYQKHFEVEDENEIFYINAYISAEARKKIDKLRSGGKTIGAVIEKLLEDVDL